MSFTKSNGLMAAALLMTMGWAESGSAQQTQESVGIVRITDGRSRSGVPQTAGCTTDRSGAPCSQGGCPTGGGGFGNCQNGNCQAHGYYGGGACQSGQCPNCRGCIGSKFCEHCCKRSPDYGYSPPSKYPLLRRGVEYNQYYPANWYGAGADYSQSQAPMVYQPTDTTQLGYTYQHVPFWQPQPNRLPERPIPAQWHSTPAAVEASGFRGCNLGYPGQNAGNCQYGGQFGGYRTTSRRMGFRSKAYDIYEVSDICSTDVTTQAAPTQPTPTPLAPQGNSVQPINPGMAPAEANPKPVEEYAPDPDPEESVNTNIGKEPGVLPPQLNTTPVPNAVVPSRKGSLPTNSAASNHIKRIGYRVR